MTARKAPLGVFVGICLLAVGSTHTGPAAQTTLPPPAPQGPMPETSPCMVRIPREQIPADLPQPVREKIEALYSLSPVAREGAARGLSADNAAAVPAIPFLIETLADESPVPRPLISSNPNPTSPAEGAARSLGYLGQLALPAVIGALDGDRPAVVGHAAQIIGGWAGMIRSAEETKQDPAKWYVLAPTRDDLQAAVPVLLKRLRDGDAPVRKWAAWCLGALRAPEAVEPLLQALRDPDDRVRQQAALVLGRGQEPRALAPLLAQLKDPAPYARMGAAWALGDLGEARAVEPLIAALQDPDENVARMAAGSLAKLQDPRAVEPLIEMLRDPRPVARYAAAYALRELGDKRAVEPLLATLADPDADVRSQVTLALGCLGDPRALKPVLGMLKDPVGQVRGTAARALALLGDKSVIPDLQLLLQDPDDGVKAAAQAALKELEGT